MSVVGDVGGDQGQRAPLGRHSLQCELFTNAGEIHKKSADACLHI